MTAKKTTKGTTKSTTKATTKKQCCGSGSCNKPLVEETPESSEPSSFVETAMQVGAFIMLGLIVLGVIIAISQ